VADVLAHVVPVASRATSNRGFFYAERGNSMISEDVRKVVNYYENQDAPPVIPFGIHFTEEDINAIRGIKSKYWSDLFEKGVEEYEKFSANVECSRCGSKTTVGDLSKTRLFELFAEGKRKTRHKRLCSECYETERREDAKRQREIAEQRSRNIDHFIEAYLDPEKQWKSDITWRDRWNSIRWIDSPEVREAIDELPYSEFLKTPYWKAVSMKAKQKANYRCQMCNEGGLLHTHHRTYDNHGAEHLHMDDLIVLCERCHYQFHQEEY
jgi:hypothetical protein